MLSTFCSLVVAVIVAYLVYHVPDFIFETWASLKIYDASMTLAEEYLAEHGRGFFEKENQDAQSMEWSVRLVLTFIYQLFFVMLAVMLIPTNYKIWLITGNSIKIGVMLGLFANLAVNMIIEYKHFSHIGRLTEINESGVGHFRGDFCDDFDVDLSAWEPDEWPPLDRRYLVLDVLGEVGIAMLDAF